MVFGHFGDRVGRKKMLVVSLLMMGFGTIAIGLLPTYATIGVAAPILLLACRLLQGFAVGGEWGGAVLMAAENGQDKDRGFWSSWPQAGVAMGNLLATGVLFVLAAVQSDAAFNAWGWRIPFLLSAVLVFVGLWVRLTLEESPVFAEAARTRSWRRSRRRTTSRSSRSSGSTPRRSSPRWACGSRRTRRTTSSPSIVMTYIVEFAKQDKGPVLQALLIGSVVHFIWIPIVGAISDRVGRRPLYLLGAVGVAVWSFVFFGLLDSNNQGKITWPIVVGLMLHALMYSPQAAFFSELFGTSVRYTGASVGYQLASIFAGALAPIVAVELLNTGCDDANTQAVGDLRQHHIGDHHHRRAVRQGDPWLVAAPRPGRPRRPREHRDARLTPADEV